MSDASSPASPQPPKRRWIKPVLFVSLALNLLFVGLTAGTVWKYKDGKRHWVPRHKAFEATLEQVIKEFPAEKAATAQKVLDRLRSEVIPKVSGRRAARKEVVEAFVADPYNEQRLKDAMGELHTIRSTTHSTIHVLALDLVRDMSVEERKKILKIFRSKRRPGKRWRQPRDGARP